MTVQVGQKDYFTFVAGLNTEASYFTFPPNTWKDGDNVVPKISGALQKRTRIDLESNYALFGRDISIGEVDSIAYTVYEWNNALDNTHYLVVQQGRYIRIYSNTSVSTSTTYTGFEIDLNSYRLSSLTYGYLYDKTPISCASVGINLLITSTRIRPILVSSTGTTFNVTSITLNIRDFTGIDDGYQGANIATKVPIASYTVAHKYNLYNQGWTQSKVDTYYTDTGLTHVPSNAQSWIYGKDTSDDFDGLLLDKQDFGNSPAPRGHYILDFITKSRNAASGISGVDEYDSISYLIASIYGQSSCAACTFFAGRAWYAGFKNDPTVVLFSQVAVDTSAYGNCYQANDPTAEVLSDLLDSDGGYITIQDAGNILDIKSFTNGVVVFATNGVWSISGTLQAGFTATGYEVKKISAQGCVSKGSVLIIDDKIYYWSNNSICVLEGDVLSTVTSKPITDNVIRTLYANIPPIAKERCRSAYNSSTKTIQWLYNNAATSTDTAHLSRKANVLVFDTRLGAFYTLSITSSTSYPYIVDVVATKETATTSVNYNVYAGSDPVIASADTVIAAVPTTYATEKQFKYLTVVPNGSVWNTTFADTLTSDDAPAKFYDWYSFDSVGVSYSSYILTGYSFDPTGPSKKHQSTYITTFMEKTETGFTVDYDPLNESSCIMQTRWDFTGTTTAGKWDAGQQVYRHTRNFIPSTIADYDDGYDVVVTKNKVRGRGRSLQLKFSAEADYDMKLLGWSVPTYGGTNV